MLRSCSLACSCRVSGCSGSPQIQGSRPPSSTRRASSREPASATSGTRPCATSTSTYASSTRRLAATLTEALVPVSRAKRWVVVGDTNQLPAHRRGSPSEQGPDERPSAPSRRRQANTVPATDRPAPRALPGHAEPAVPHDPPHRRHDLDLLLRREAALTERRRARRLRARATASPSFGSIPPPTARPAARRLPTARARATPTAAEARIVINRLEGSQRLDRQEGRSTPQGQRAT